MTHSLGNSEIIARLQQRDWEQSQTIAMSESLAPVTTKSEFNNVAITTLKNTIGFSQLIICIKTQELKTYKLFYHSCPAAYLRHKNDIYTTNSAIFSTALNSPEPFILSKYEFVKATGASSPINNGFKDSVINIVTCSISSKNYKAVLFFGFEKANIPDRKYLQLIKTMLVQLNITFTNILLLEKIINISLIPETDARPLASESHMGIIGNSDPINKIRNLIKLVSTTNSGVLIQGESGTGKELVAKAIHNNSTRYNAPLVSINCAAIPKDLLESELFGHEKGSFTGAVAKKTGKFEQAHTGTLFLDDVSEMPLELQVKLLRVLQEKEIQRIGSNATIIVDTRIIAATNKDLQEEVDKGNFRADLFYRLNVFPINLPPLRDRLDDVIHLTNFFIQHYCAKNKNPVKKIAVKALNALKIYNWPGNVRELEHAIERALLLSPGKVILKVPIGNNKEINQANGIDTIKPWHEFEKQYILSVLKFCNGKLSGPNGAASLLQIPSTTLRSKMERLGIKKRHYLSDK